MLSGSCYATARHRYCILMSQSWRWWWRQLKAPRRGSDWSGLGAAATLLTQSSLLGGTADRAPLAARDTACVRLIHNVDPGPNTRETVVEQKTYDFLVFLSIYIYLQSTSTCCSLILIVTALLQPVDLSISISFLHDIVKLREREGQRVDLGRSLKGHL